MDTALLKNKFRGTMLGVLIGDCLGSPYEGLEKLSRLKKTVLQRKHDKLWKTKFREPVMTYTDDSAMTRALAESLIEKRDLDIVDVAQRFARSYYENPDRGYGAGTITILKQWKEHVDETNVKIPAKNLFDGLGSYGNGGAMKIAPVPLFAYNNYDKLLYYVKEVTKITHTHELGINGAILQAIAIQQSLHLNPSEELNVSNFVDNLINKMDKIGDDSSQLYKERLSIVKNLVSEEGDDPNEERVVQELGNSIRALESVPTAIFCFLRAQRRIRRIRTDNPLRRAIQYAITLGGDTDTIASMAGAIAGAFYGYEKFSIQLLSHCEEWELFREIGDKMLDLAMSQINK
ncbi:hypothetical protein P5V15_000208 [Pogonomyrmex californicus]